MLAWEHDHQWMTGKRLVGVLPSLLNCYFLEDVKIHSLSQDMDFWNPTWFAYYFLFQDVKNHSSQESLPQSLPDHADAWPKSKSYTSKLWLLFAVIWKWPIQVAGRYQSGKTSVCCLFKEVNVGYLWIQLWWEYLCWTTCWILTVIWTLILDQLGIGSSPNHQYQVLEYSEHRLFSRGKNPLPALEGLSTIKVRSN
jgi:hypothetical protein